MTLSLEDRLDISDVLVRYATGIDRRDWALFRSVFTDDCTCDYGAIGTWHGAEEITTFMEQAHAPLGQTLHRLTNIAITPTAQGATTRTYVEGLVMVDANHGVSAVGFYDDDLVRGAGGWQVARRTFTSVLMQAEEGVL